MLVVIDSGNYSTKYFYSVDSSIRMGCFLSIVHDYVHFATDDLSGAPRGMNRVQFGAIDVFVGEGVKNLFAQKQGESLFTGNVRKGHIDSVARIILALQKIHEATGEFAFDLVLTSPIASRSQDKEYFSKIFSGNMSAHVDNRSFDFSIDKLIIAAEGLGATEFTDQLNYVVVDVGSQTTNIVRMVGGVMTEESATINGGTHSKTPEQIAKIVFRALSDVDFSFPIFVSGGKSADIMRALREVGYSNCECSAIPDTDMAPYYINGYGIYLIAQKMLNRE